MPYEITSAPTTVQREQTPDVETFVQNLRRCTKSSIVDAGAHLLWTSYKNKKKDAGFDAQRQILHAYGSRIVVLALATANEYRDKNLTLEGFHNLCTDYLGIHDTISDQEFLKREAEKVIASIKAATKNKIPEKYLTFDHIRSSCTELFVARLAGSQNKTYGTNIHEFSTDYKIISMLDEITSGAVTKVFQELFCVSPLHVMRAGFMLFALGCDDRRNGRISFNGMSCDDAVRESFQITPEICQSVAAKISCNESDLRDWYMKGVLNCEPYYQKHFPDPLYRYPLIHRDLKTENIDFLIPAPALFLRSFRIAIFSRLLEANGNLSGKLGDVLEAHIKDALEHIFGADKVKKIEDSGKKADFHIALGNCDLIIEVKTNIGSYEARSVMSPEHTADVWGRLYGACEQCAASMRVYKQASRPIIGLILMADHMTTETIPFHTLAERSGMFDDLGIECVEFLSWNALESTLSRTSIDKFAAGLLEKWKDKSKMQVGDVMSLDFDRDAPAHKYEYLKEADLQIFGAKMSGKMRDEDD
jgi:hypothetical protein